MYEFKIVEWTANWGIQEMVTDLNELGKAGWFLAHVHEVMKGGQVLLLLFMQRRIKEG